MKVTFGTHQVAIELPSAIAPPPPPAPQQLPAGNNDIGAVDLPKGRRPSVKMVNGHIVQVAVAVKNPPKALGVPRIENDLIKMQISLPFTAPITPHLLAFQQDILRLSADGNRWVVTLWISDTDVQRCKNWEEVSDLIQSILDKPAMWDAITTALRRVL